MLKASEQESEDIVEYMNWQAPDLKVEMVQKVYSENVLGVQHDVWDVHTDKDRWWVITNPTNLYSQDQFPNLDIALTFHVGLGTRMIRSESKGLDQLEAEPFAEPFRYLYEAHDALGQAEEVADYQALGVRCREALLAFAVAAQIVVPWTSAEALPKKADLKAWADHICSVVLPGDTHEYRRHLFKTLMDSSWKFANWLTHTKNSKWHDAEACLTAVENALGLMTSTVIRHIREVPEECPACGSHRLSPERGFHTAEPEVWWERPVCTKCGWFGKPVVVDQIPQPPMDDSEGRSPPEGECSIQTVPLRKLLRP
jgi:hypothetical protein